MSKERLDEIKENYGFAIYPKTVDWLIKQAEQLEKIDSDRLELIIENKRYREALNNVLNNDEMYITNEEIILSALEGDPL